MAEAFETERLDTYLQAYEQLEHEFGAWQFGKGSPLASNVVACSSGTAALHLGLESLQLPLGSVVIVPDFTMVACARAVVIAGLKPVFVDCGADMLIDPELAEDAAADGAAAIMPVHIYGRRCNMAAIHEIAGKYDLAVIEDMAEAHGVAVHPNTDVACWSYYVNKIIAGEEGGACAFRFQEHAERARQLRCLGFTAAHDFTHIPRGCNYRMANAAARLIIDSLRQSDQNIERRRQVESWYNEACPDEWRLPPRDAPWVYDLRIPDLRNQAEVVAILNRDGIAARFAFKPMTSQKEFWTKKIPPRATKLSREVIYLPLMYRPDVGREIATKAFALIREHVRKFQPA